MWTGSPTLSWIVSSSLVAELFVTGFEMIQQVFKSQCYSPVLTVIKNLQSFQMRLKEELLLLRQFRLSPHLMPQNFCYAQTQGAILRPNLFNSLSEIIPPNPSLQSSLPTSRPLYLPSFHLSPPYLPFAVAPPRFPPAAVASSPLVAAASTPHRPVPSTTPPHPAPHNSAFPHNPLLLHPFNPAHPLSILPPHVTTKRNSQNFTYLCSSPVSCPPLGPLAASSPTPPIYGSTIARIAESPASSYPGLLSCIVAQGLLSCPSCLSKDALIDFHAGFLYVRHEPSINALYYDLS